MNIEASRVAEFSAEKRQVALHSMLAAAVMTLLKLGAGLMSGSLGVLSDAAHSGLDMVGSMLTFFFTAGPVTDWDSAERCDRPRFAQFFHWMLDRGFCLPPSQFEAAFVSAAHSEEDIERTAAVIRQFFTGA